ncbi:MAG: response regulator transcription factor [Chloroflexota bacterium]
MSKTSLMLVDDHPLFRQGLRRVLEANDDLEVIMEVADGEEALRLAKQLTPDVVIMDINLPRMNGLQVTRELKQAAPDVAIIMLTAYHDDEQIFHSVRAGAAAYFPKDVTPRRLVEAIRQVSKGNYVVDDEVLNKPEVASWLLQQFDKVAYVDGLPNEMFALAVVSVVRNVRVIDCRTATCGKARAVLVCRGGSSSHPRLGWHVGLVRVVSWGERVVLALSTRVATCGGLLRWRGRTG